jgi:imidazolonepropionase-like amidohydrolase
MSHAFVTPMPKLDPAVMAAIIAAAHAQKRKVMIHAYETPNHKATMRAGADIMAHSAVTDPIDAEYLDLAGRSRTLYLGTLSVYHDVFDANAIRELAALEAIRKTVPNKTLATLTQGPVLEGFEASIKGEYFKRQLPTIMGNMKRAFDAGIPVGVGPDTGVPGAFPGFAVHREMELMVMAGIPPADVLVAATRTGARYLGQPSLGTIETGKVADAVIVAGDPSRDITSTRNVETVVKGGAVVDRSRLLDEIMAVG